MPSVSLDERVSIQENICEHELMVCISNRSCRTMNGNVCSQASGNDIQAWCSGAQSHPILTQFRKCQNKVQSDFELFVITKVRLFQGLSLGHLDRGYEQVMMNQKERVPLT